MEVFKRNLDIVIHAHKLVMVKEVSKNKVTDMSNKVAENNADAINKETPVTDSDDEFYTQSFFDTIDAICEKLRKSTEFMELIKSSDSPIFKLISSQEWIINSENSIPSEVLAAIPSQELNHVPNIPIGIPVSAPNKVPAVPVIKPAVMPNRVLNVPTAAPNAFIVKPVNLNGLLKDINIDYNLDSVVPSRSVHGLIGFSLDFGDGNEDYQFVSKVLMRFKTLLQDMPFRLKQVVDFLFSKYLELTDDGECFYYFGPGRSVVLKDITSMQEDIQITTNMLDSYGLVFNAVESENGGIMSRFTFGCSQSQLLTEPSKRCSLNKSREFVEALTWCGTSPNWEFMHLTETTNVLTGIL